jgi:hypothetical protein
MLVRGAEPMENASNAAFYGPGLCWLCSHVLLRYPLILWITVLPPLSELIPLAAAERPSAASQ